jgi:5-methyltetrahydrofolate--homocysteine methyltransferase
LHLPLIGTDWWVFNVPRFPTRRLQPKLPMKSLLAALRRGQPLVSDGAWGTFLYQRGLTPGECPELWNVTHPADVAAIAESYVAAGADIILTNSFGGSPHKLAAYGLADRAAELNVAAAAISRAAAGGGHFVLGSMGPTGVMLMMGEVPEETLAEGFALQAAALQRGGVDALCLETFSAVDEASVAIRAAKDATGLEIACTFTFEKTVTGDFRTMMGVSVEEMVAAVKEAGADIIGTNCGNGFEQMINIVRAIRRVDTTTPVLVHANAGKPLFIDGRTLYPETPADMAGRVGELLAAGANIVGGCCGTGPAHIRALADAIRRR